MQPPERFQVAVIQSLNPHRYAVHARIAVARKSTGLDRSRIGLKRNFNIVCHGPSGAHFRQNRINDVGIHQAWRSAPKEDRSQDAAFGFGPDAFNLAQIGRLPGFLVNLRDNVTVKIAIGAFCLTKRPVNIEAKAAMFPVFHLRQNIL